MEPGLGMREPRIRDEATGIRNEGPRIRDRRRRRGGQGAGGVSLKRGRGRRGLHLHPQHRQRPVHGPRGEIEDEGTGRRTFVGSQ